MNISYQCLSFNELSLEDLYAMMRLRQEVFVVEQDCPYLDADGLDQAALHVLGFDANHLLVAYARLLPKGVAYEDYPAIGRVVNAPGVRGKGVGMQLMEASIRQLISHYGVTSIKISAQFHLTKFYELLGFKAVGEQYLEDNIPHIAMIRD